MITTRNMMEIGKNNRYCYEKSRKYELGVVSIYDNFRVLRYLHFALAKSIIGIGRREISMTENR